MSFNQFYSPRTAFGPLLHQEYPSIGQPSIMSRKSSGGGSVSQSMSGGREAGAVRHSSDLGARRIGDRLMTGGETEGRTLPARNELCGCGRTKLSRYNRSIECFLCQEERAGSAVHR